MEKLHRKPGLALAVMKSCQRSLFCNTVKLVQMTCHTVPCVVVQCFISYAIWPRGPFPPTVAASYMLFVSIYVTFLPAEMTSLPAPWMGCSAGVHLANPSASSNVGYTLYWEMLTFDQVTGIHSLLGDADLWPSDRYTLSIGRCWPFDQVTRIHSLLGDADLWPSDRYTLSIGRCWPLAKWPIYTLYWEMLTLGQVTGMFVINSLIAVECHV